MSLQNYISLMEQGKSDIAHAIANKGVDMTNVLFADYASKINEIIGENGGSIGTKETILWTNSSPSSEFTSKSITLTDLNGYDYLAFVYKANTSTTSLEKTIVDINQFKQSVEKAKTEFVFALNSANAAGDLRTRPIYYVSNTSIKFGASEGDGSAYNGTNIPCEVIGIKNYASSDIDSDNIKLAQGIYSAHYNSPSGTLVLNTNGVKVLNVIAEGTSEGSVHSITLTLNLLDGTTQNYISNSNVMAENVVSISVTTKMTEKINNTVSVACVYKEVTAAEE